MTAFDRSSDPGLSPDTLTALQAALTRSLKNGNHDEELRKLLSSVATEAREKNMLAEQLLVTLKGVWYAIPEVAAARGREIAPTLLQELISRCIEQYYGGDNPRL